MDTMEKELETGDIYFFYRPKVNVDLPKKIADVQRLYMVVVPDEGEKGRIFLIGKKRLPQANENNSSSWRELRFASPENRIFLEGYRLKKNSGPQRV